jgi:hypothetical protein
VTPDSYNGSMLWITVRCDAGRVAAAQCAVLGIADAGADALPRP